MNKLLFEIELHKDLKSHITTKMLNEVSAKIKKLLQRQDIRIVITKK